MWSFWCVHVAVVCNSSWTESMLAVSAAAVALAEMLIRCWSGEEKSMICARRTQLRSGSASISSQTFSWVDWIVPCVFFYFFLFSSFLHPCYALSLFAVYIVKIMKGGCFLVSGPIVWGCWFFFPLYFLFSPVSPCSPPPSPPHLTGVFS